MNCKNCQAIISHIKTNLYQAGREFDMVDGIEAPSEGSYESFGEKMKLQKRINFWRRLLDIVEPPPDIKTGIFKSEE